MCFLFGFYILAQKNILSGLESHTRIALFTSQPKAKEENETVPLLIQLEKCLTISLRTLFYFFFLLLSCIVFIFFLLAIYGNLISIIKITHTYTDTQHFNCLSSSHYYYYRSTLNRINISTITSSLLTPYTFPFKILHTIYLIWNAIKFEWIDELQK